MADLPTEAGERIERILRDRLDAEAIVKARQRLAPILTAARKELGERIAAATQAGNNYTAAQAAAYRVQIEGAVTKLAANTGKAVTGLMGAAGQESLHTMIATMNLAQAAAGAAPVPRVAFAQLSRLVGAFGQQTSLLQHFYDRGNQSALNYGQQLITGFEGILANGLATGQTTDSVSNAILNSNQGFGQAWWRAERIARTEISYAFNATAREGAKELEADYPDLMTRWVEHVADGTRAPLDDRVGEDSIRLHGQLRFPGQPFHDIVNKRDVTEPPNRPNDRATIVTWRASWGEPPGGLAGLDATSKATFAEALKRLAAAKAKGGAGAEEAEKEAAKKAAEKAAADAAAAEKKRREAEAKKARAKARALKKATPAPAPAPQVLTSKEIEKTATIKKREQREITAKLDTWNDVLGGYTPGSMLTAITEIDALAASNPAGLVRAYGKWKRTAKAKARLDSILRNRVERALYDVSAKQYAAELGATRDLSADVLSEGRKFAADLTAKRAAQPPASSTLHWGSADRLDGDIANALSEAIGLEPSLAQGAKLSGLDEIIDAVNRFARRALGADSMALKADGSPAITINKSVARGFYNGTTKIDAPAGHIALSGRTPAESGRTYTHELGHLLERWIPGLQRQANAILEREKDRSIAANPALKITSRTDAGQVCDWYPGDFYGGSYAGKLYSSKQTEIISMGLESLLFGDRIASQAHEEVVGLIIKALRGDALE